MTTKMIPTRTLLRALVGTTLAAACNCGQVDPPTPTLAIIDPVTGRELTILDDLDPATAGLQFQAVLQATELDGVPVALVATQGQLAQSATGTITNGAATLAFTLSGNVTIIARATPEGGEPVDSAPVVLTRDASPVKCVIVAPADGAVLTTDADASRPGFQTDAEIRCGGLAAGAELSARVGGSLVGTGTLGGNGTATLRGLDLAEGENILVVVAADDRNTATARTTVTVDSGGCRLLVAPRSGTVFNARGEGDHDSVVADLVPGAPMTAVVQVTHDCAGATIEVRDGEDVLGSALATLSPLSVNVNLPDGELDLRAFAVGARTGTSPEVTYRVDSVLPNAAFTRPTASASYGPQDDASADDGFQLAFAGTFTGIDVGAAYELVINPGGATEQVLPGTVAAGGAFAQTLTLAPGTYDAVARATRPLGTVASTGIVRFSVVAGAPSIALVSPTTGQSLDLRADVSPGEAGFQLRVDVASSLVGAGAVTVTCNGASATGTLAADGTGSVDVTVSTPACGANAISCDASAVRGGVTIRSEPVAFTVDAARPTAVLVSPTPGTVVAGPVDVSVTLACAGESVTATLSRDGVALAGPAAFSDVVTFPQVALVAGSNALSIELADAAGNDALVELALVLDAEAPLTRFVDPPTGETVSWGTGDDSDADLSNGLQRTILVRVDNEPADTAVQLVVDGIDPIVARTVATEGGLIATFTGVSIPEGETLLQACAVDAAGSSGCDELTVTVDTSRPTCVIAAPLDGAVLSAAADMNAATPGVQQNVTVSTSAADAAVVRVEVTKPDLTTESFEAAAAGGAATVEVTLAADGAYVLAARCDATAETPGLSLPVDVSFDGSVPAAAIEAPADAAVLNLATVDASADDGFQVVVRIASTEQDGEAEAVVTCNGTPASLGPVALAVGVAELPPVTVPALANCSVSARVRDVAGNTSVAAVSTFRVDRVAPAVEIDQPVDGSLLGATRDADTVTPGLQLSLIRAIVGNDPGTTYVLTLNGTASTVAPAYDGSRVVWTNTTLADGANTIAIVATDAAGNVTTASVSVTADLNAPSVNIQNPIAAQLTRRNDLDANAPGLQVNVTLSGSKLDNGTTVRICSPQADAGAAACQTGGGRRLAEATLAGGAALVPAVTLPQGNIQFYAEAIDVFSNVATSTVINTRVDSIPLLVNSIAAFNYEGGTETPLDLGNGDVYFGRANDSDPVAPGFQVRLRATLGRLDGLSSYSVRFVTNQPAPNTTLATVASAADGTATANVTLIDAHHHVFVEVLDAVGNLNSTPSAPIPGETPTEIRLGADTVPPTVAITRPRPRLLLKVDDVDAATPGLQFNAEIDTDAGTGRTVRLFVDGAEAATGTTSGRVATVRVTIPEGAHALVARTTDGAGNEGSSATVNVTVDSVAPAIAITSPSDGASLDTDADPVAAGFQIPGPQVTYSQVEAGRTISLRSSVGGLLATATTDAGGVAVFPALSVPGGAQVLTAEVADANGNLTVSAGINVTVAATAPFIRFASNESPFFFGLADDTVPGGGCDLVIEATCDSNGSTAVLLVDGVESAPATVSANAVSFSGVQVAAGATVTLQLRATDTLDRTGLSPTRQATCDLTAPTISLVDPPAGATVRYVAHGNPGNVAGARADLLPSNVLEADFRVSVSGAAAGTVSVGGAVDGLLDTEAVASDAATEVAFLSTTVPTPGAQTLTFTVTDRAGNTGTATLAIDADVRPPAAIRPDVTIPDRRLTAIELTFVAPGGDATDSGPVASYVVRRADAAIESEAAWAAATAVTPLAHTISAPGAQQVLRVDGLPFERAYHFAVRAIDAAGNLGPLPSSAADAADTRFQRRTITAPLLGSGTLAGRMVVGDLDGDGLDDIVASAGTAESFRGLVRVHYGSAGAPVAPVDILGPVGEVARFGTGLAVGDVNGDGRADLIVGAQNQDDPAVSGVTADGAVHVFLGRENVRLTAASAADAVIQGRRVASETLGMGTTVAVVKDIDGDGIDDILASALRESGGAGKGMGVVHVFRGRSTWPAVLTRADGLYATIVTSFLTPTANSPTFGQTMANLGDIGGSADAAATPDGRGEFVVVGPTGSFTTAAVRPAFVVSGRLLDERVAALVAASAAPVVEVEGVSLAVNAPSMLNSQWGVGVAAGDVTGDSLSDLMIADAVGPSTPSCRVELFDGAALASSLPVTLGVGTTFAGNPLTRLTVTDAFNAAVQVSFLRDVTGDGIGEIAVTRSGSVNFDRVNFWRGRAPGAWAGVTQPELQILRDIATEGSGFGFTVRGAFHTGAARRDLIIHNLNGGISVLTDP